MRDHFARRLDGTSINIKYLRRSALDIKVMLCESKKCCSFCIAKTKAKKTFSIGCDFALPLQAFDLNSKVHFLFLLHYFECSSERYSLILLRVFWNESSNTKGTFFFISLVDSEHLPERFEMDLLMYANFPCNPRSSDKFRGRGISMITLTYSHNSRFTYSPIHLWMDQCLLKPSWLHHSIKTWSTNGVEGTRHMYEATGAPIEHCRTCMHPSCGKERLNTAPLSPFVRYSSYCFLPHLIEALDG